MLGRFLLRRGTPRRGKNAGRGAGADCLGSSQRDGDLFVQAGYLSIAFLRWEKLTSWQPADHGHFLKLEEPRSSSGSIPSCSRIYPEIPSV